MKTNPYDRALDVISKGAMIIATLFITTLPLSVLLITGQWIPWLLIPLGVALTALLFAFMSNRWDEKNG